LFVYLSIVCLSLHCLWQLLTEWFPPGGFVDG